MEELEWTEVWRLIREVDRFLFTVTPSAPTPPQPVYMPRNPFVAQPSTAAPGPAPQQGFFIPASAPPSPFRNVHMPNILPSAQQTAAEQPGDGVNTCKTCGYKLTLLFTSTACDRCDGLLPPPVPKQVSLISVGSEVYYQPPGWAYARFIGGTVTAVDNVNRRAIVDFPGVALGWYPLDELRTLPADNP